MPKKGLVFNPYHELNSQIKTAADRMTTHFAEIDSALDKGKSVKKAVAPLDLKPVMSHVIATARMSGFHAGALHSNKKTPILYGRTVMDAASRRGAYAARSIRRTTRKTLRSVPDSQFVLSRERALQATRYEVARAFYSGVGDAFRGESEWGKVWVTSAADACIECQDNEGDGIIDVDDNFSSGHDYPSAHLGCSCYVEMRKL